MMIHVKFNVFKKGRGLSAKGLIEAKKRENQFSCTPLVPLTIRSTFDIDTKLPFGKGRCCLLTRCVPCAMSPPYAVQHSAAFMSLQSAAQMVYTWI